MEQQVTLARCATFAGMGMGKTSSTLSSIKTLQLLGEESGPALVLAPKRVAQSTWPDEVKKWEHLQGVEIQPLIGDAEYRRRALRSPNASVFTINYENIPWLLETLGDAWPFATVVADESTRLKNFRISQGSVRARALAPIAHKKVRRWINLTGTPASNGIKDLWGQMWFIDGGRRLGRSFKAFQDRWFDVVPTGQKFTTLRPRPFAQQEIQELIADVTLSVRAADYFDLKKPIATTIPVTLPEKARRIYRDLELEMFASFGEHEVDAVTAAARSMKCHQLANGAVYLESDKWVEVHDMKLQALESIIEESAGAPVLVAYHFNSDLAMLQRAFPKGRVLDDDPATIREWNAGKIPILFAHPASAGHGLNLQDGGNIAVYYSIDWNLENHEQILERIGPTRQLQAGHDRPVFVYYILAEGTVDELIKARLEGKGSVQDLLLEAMKRRK